MGYMNEVGHIVEHTLEHSIADTLYLIPFLFVTYLAMEWLEHKTGRKTQDAIRRAGAAGPVVGALLGAVPQCGFSAAAATLWAGRVITLGTLCAVFLSTSDEMIPVFLAEGASLGTILSVLGAKIVIGMVMGFAIDAAARLFRKDDEGLRIHELCERDRCHCSGHQDCAACAHNPASVYEHHDAQALEQVTETHEDGGSDGAGGGCEHHSHGHEAGWGDIFKSALIHTVQVTLFIFIVTCVLNGILETVGEEALGAVFNDNPVFSVLLSALIGLIPNCAASVVIAQLYLDGILGAGAMLAGLLTAAGVGLLVLFRTNRHWKQNVGIVAILYACGVFWGLVCLMLGIAF